MNHFKFCKYLGIIFFCCTTAAAAPAAHPAAKTRNYSDKEFGFSFKYPASWTVSPAVAPNSRARVVSPATTPHAECAVIVKRYPNAASAQQSDIDEIFAEAPSPAELKEMLNQGPIEVEVVTATSGTLHSRPAHLARVRYSAGTPTGKMYASGRVAMTATPGLTWTLSCSGQGDTPAKAEQSFQSRQGEINGIVSSFKFKKILR